MKNLNILILFILIISTQVVLSQQVGVGTNNPDPSAKLDIQSTTSGLLIPRMTSSQRLAISSPVKGLMVFDNTTDSFWFFDGTIWNNISSSSVSLDNAYDEGGAGLGRKITATDSAVQINGTDGFYVTGTFGQGTDVEIEGAGAKMFFNPKKSAFRVGTVFDEFFDGRDSYWDNDSIGEFSFASGYNTRALGTNSTAMGDNTYASGNNSISMGYYSKAMGSYSTAMGKNTRALGASSTAIGNYTEASGNNSTAMGYITIASGGSSTAIGYYSRAIGIHSTVMGYYSTAMGDYSTAIGSHSRAMGNYSIAIGSYSVAAGNYSTASGYRNKTNGPSSTVIGQFNDTIIAHQTSMTNTTPLFIIGNGDDDMSRSNAFVVRKDGRVQINDEYTLPTLDGTANQVMTTDGSGIVTWQNGGAGGSGTLDNAYDEGGAGLGRKIEASDSSVQVNGTDGLYVTGTFGLGTDVEIEGPGTRMFFNPHKAAFRAGRVVGNEWDNNNIGDDSFATGFNNIASGSASTAMGVFSRAIGINAIALGNQAEALGINSISIGLQTKAEGYGSLALGRTTLSSGFSSTALGYFTTANAHYSTSIGYNTKTNGPASTVIGQYNDTIIARQTTISGTTPLFIVGNGDGDMSRSNAFVVRKDGKAGFGVNPSSDRVQVNSISGENALRVQVAGQTKLRVFANGSIALGNNNGSVGSGDVYVHNDLGVGVNNPSERIEVNGNILASGMITSSDVRYKKDIQSIENSTKALSKVNPVSYTFKTEEFPEQFDDKKHLGVIAQELEKLFPDMVYTNNEGFKAVNYTEFIPLLIQSNQEQQEKINELIKKTEDLYKIIIELKASN